jgi:hypothetical protein
MIQPDNPVNPPAYLDKQFTNQQAALEEMRRAFQEEMEDVRQMLMHQADNPEQAMQVDRLTRDAHTQFELELPQQLRDVADALGAGRRRNVGSKAQLPPAPQPIVEEQPEENLRGRQDNVNLRVNPLFEPHIHRINRMQMLPAPNQPEALPAIEQPLALPAPNQPLALPAPPQDINENYNNAINLIDLYYNETSPRIRNQYGRRIRKIAKQFDIETKSKSLDWIIEQIQDYKN